MRGSTSVGYDQFETSPEAIEQELRPAVCERRLTDRLKTNYSIDDRTCSASGMFEANNEIWRKSLYNFKQRVTKSNNIIVTHIYNFTRATSTIWKNFDRILYIV